MKKTAEKAKAAGFDFIYSVIKSENGRRLYHLVSCDVIIKFGKWIPASIQLIPDGNGASGVKVYAELPPKSIRKSDAIRRFGKEK